MKKKQFLWIGVVIVLAAIGWMLYLGSDDAHIDLGQTRKLIETTIDGMGGTIEIDDEVWSGFKLLIPENAFDASVTFNIESTEINSHEFGEVFEPITPLLSVNNGKQKANIPMTLTLPIDIDTETEFAMGFFYDVENGTLEAIPAIDLSDDAIVLLTTHFSSVVVSKITIEELEKAYLPQGKVVDTGFVPGVDDWSFVNYGSAIAPYGHCAGQALTMGWYFSARRTLGDEPLFTRYDNNHLEPTPDFWQDDSLGYRFASTIQASIDWEAEDFQAFIDYSSRYNPRRIKQSFAYAMLVTGEPQFMGIYEKDAFGVRSSGHAILAYKVTQNRIYVADPNYPGQQERFIEMDGSHFNPYSSGSNAQDISTNGAIAYNDFLFIGTWALVDEATIAAHYDALLEGTIGAPWMPSIFLEYLSAYDFDDPNQNEWTVLGHQLILDPKVHNPLMPLALQDKILLSTTTGHDDVALFLYRENTLIDGPIFPDEEGYAYFEASLTSGENSLGVLAMLVENDNYYYSDFKRLTVHFGEKGTPVDENVNIVCFSDNISKYHAHHGNFWGTYRFESRSDGLPGPAYAYITFYTMEENDTHPNNYVWFEYETQDGYHNSMEGRWQIVLGETYHELEFRSEDWQSIHAVYRMSEDYTYLYETNPDNGTTFTYVKVFCE